MSKYIKNPFVVSGLFLLFSFIFLSIFFNKISRDSTIKQVQYRQQLSVRAGGKSIEIFLSSIGKTSVAVANDTSYSKLDELVATWSDSNISGLVVTDKDGILIRNSNILMIRDTSGVDLSGRDYFKWAKLAKKGDYKIFSPVISKAGTSKGKSIVTISTPIIKNNQFDGVLTIAVLLSDLSREYLDNLKVLDSSRIYLISSSGEIIYSDNQEYMGKNVENIFEKDFLGKKKIIEIILDELGKNSESKLSLALPNFENNYILEPYLISSAPVNVSDQLWKVFVVTPENDLNAFTSNMFNKQIIAFFIFVVLFILLTLRSSRNSGYHEAVSNEHKIHGIDQKISLK